MKNDRKRRAFILIEDCIDKMAVAVLTLLLGVLAVCLFTFLCDKGYGGTEIALMCTAVAVLVLIMLFWIFRLVDYFFDKLRDEGKRKYLEELKAREKSNEYKVRDD